MRIKHSNQSISPSQQKLSVRTIPRSSMHRRFVGKKKSRRQGRGIPVTLIPRSSKPPLTICWDVV